MEELEAGKFYWIRHKHERIWRPAYAGMDPDEDLWIHIVGLSPLQVSKMDLSFFDIRELPPPID